MGESSSTAGTAASRWIQGALLFLLMASFAVRLHGLGAKSLWTDEGLTVRRAEQPIGLVLRNQNLIPVEPNYYDGSEAEVVATPDLHPPLYFVLMHFWTRATGQTEFLLRFPSVVASTLVLPLLFALGSTVLSKEAGLWAVLLAAFSPFYTWHAQEARMYAWVVLFGVASVYTFLPLLKESAKLHHYLVYAAATSALLYTHYTGFLLLAFELLIYSVYQVRRRGGAGPVLAILAMLAVVVVPLSPYILRALNLSLFGFVSRPLPILLAEVWSYFSLGLSESLIRPIWETAPFLALFAVGAGMVGVPDRCKAWAVCLGYLGLPLLLFHVMSYFKPNYMNPRHLLAMSPAWELVMAQGLTTLRQRSWPSFVILLSVALFLRGQASYDIFASHRMWKDDIRGAVEYIEARARPGDAIILHDPVIRLTIDYYYDGPHPVTAIPGYAERDEQEAIGRFAEWVQLYDRIWFLHGPPPAHFPKDVLPQWADTHLFKVDEQSFEAIWTQVGVTAYDEEPPIYDAPPPDAQPSDVAWGPLHLVGLQARQMVQGDTGCLEFYWQVEEAGLDDPLRLKVRFLDPGGMVWYEREEELLPFYPPSGWPTDGIVKTDLRIAVPSDLPPITYKVEAALVGLGDLHPVGELGVARSSQPPPGKHPNARFEGGIVLLDSELGSNVFRAGNPLFASLTWRSAAPIEEDYRVRVRLTNLRGHEATSGVMTPSASGFPTTQWMAGEQVAGRLVLPLPADMKSGRYRVEISLVGTSTGRVLPARYWYGEREWVSLGMIKVQAWPLMTRVPDGIEQRMEEVEIAGRVQLRGYDLTHLHDALKLTLYWQAQSSVEQTYHVFVHVGVRDQPPLTDAGGVPVNWTRPTTTWREGEVIVDEHVISLSHVPPGRYELLVGLYEPETGSRPKTVVSDEVVPGGYVVLQEIDVE